VSAVDVEPSTEERGVTPGYMKHPAPPHYTCRLVDLDVYGAFDDTEHLSQLG
jgi:hypothetical protein